MPKKKEPIDKFEFTRKLLNNEEITIPNEFTLGMGNLIKLAREKKGLSQLELAKKLNRRRATISDIENGKSEIGVITLVQFALTLEKPISYFFPKSVFRDQLVDVRSKFEHDMLELAKLIEIVSGNTKLALDVMSTLADNFQEEYQDPDGYNYAMYEQEGEEEDQ